MTEHTVSPSNAVPGRQLLGEFAAAIEPHNNRQLLAHVMEAVKAVNLETVQLAHIHEAFLQAVARAVRSGEQAASARLRVRIWVMGACDLDHGWGFFLVEKDDDSRNVGLDADYLVELFLYQESGS